MAEHSADNRRMEVRILPGAPILSSTLSEKIVYNLKMLYKTLDISELDSITDRPLYILVAGSAGVGKTTLFRKYCKKFSIMDIDDVIIELGGGEYSRKNTPAAIELITKRVFEMMENKESFVAMGTSSVLRMAIERLTNAKEMGYHTVLVHIWAPLDQIVRQNRERMELGGRGVAFDEEYKIKEMFDGSNKTVKFLKRSDLIDYFISYNNTRDI